MFDGKIVRSFMFPCWCAFLGVPLWTAKGLTTAMFAAMPVVTGRVYGCGLILWL
jgi:hypothetical protein